MGPNSLVEGPGRWGECKSNLDSIALVASNIILGSYWHGTRHGTQKSATLLMILL